MVLSVLKFCVYTLSIFFACAKLCIPINIVSSKHYDTTGSAGMDMLNAPKVQSRQPLTYRLMESVGLGGPR